LIPHEGEEKDTTKGTIKIGDKLSCQMSHMLSGRQKTSCTFHRKMNGMHVYIDAIRESPNGRHSKDLMPKSKPKPLGAKWAKREIEEVGDPHGGRTEKA
jgi:hypothetical protein